MPVNMNVNGRSPAQPIQPIPPSTPTKTNNGSPDPLLAYDNNPFVPPLVFIQSVLPCTMAAVNYGVDISFGNSKDFSIIRPPAGMAVAFGGTAVGLVADAVTAPVRAFKNASDLWIPTK